MPKNKSKPRPKPDDAEVTGGKGPKAGPNWLLGRNQKWGPGDLFRLARQFHGLQGFFGDEEEESEGGIVYEDDVNYYGPPPGTPGGGQYVGDYSQGAPQTPPQAPYGPLASQMTDDPWAGFWTEPQPHPSEPNALTGGVLAGEAAPHVPVNSKGGSLTPLQVAQLAHQAGFRGDGLRQMVATVFPESGGRPTAHNPNAGTGDNSYGLAQINMLGNLGPERMKQFGIRSNEDLFDPLTNLKAAFQVSGGGKNFSPWSAWKKGLHQQYLDEADAAIAELTKQLQGEPNAVAGGVVEPKPENEEEDDD